MRNRIECAARNLVPAVAVAALLVLAPLHTAGAQAKCKDWAARWSSIAGFVKFFEVEGEQLDNLVANFNLASPQTDYGPDMAGYSWGGGDGFARLYMVAEGCILVEQVYPLKLVWRMMGSYPAVPGGFDKSGDSYLKELEALEARRQKLRQQEMEAEREAGVGRDSPEPDESGGEFMEDLD